MQVCAAVRRPGARGPAGRRCARTSRWPGTPSPCTPSTACCWARRPRWPGGSARSRWRSRWASPGGTRAAVQDGRGVARVRVPQRRPDPRGARRAAAGPSSYDPDDLAVYADIAGTLADNGRLDEALELDRPGAGARSGVRLRGAHRPPAAATCATATSAHLVALADFVRDHPDDTHEHSDLAECCRGRPWLGQLTPAGGAGRRRAAPGVADDGNGPRRAVRLPARRPAERGRGPAIADRPRAADRGRRRAEPDPREPRRATGPAVVALRRTRPPRPPCRRPRPTAVERIAAARPPGVAAPTGGVRRGGGPGRPGPGATCSACWCTRRRRRPTRWAGCWPPTTRRSGCAACRCGPAWGCCTTAPTSRGQGSTRRRVLLDLIWGVEDWVTEAALFALVTAAWVDPAVRPDVARVVAERLADVADRGAEPTGPDRRLAGPPGAGRPGAGPGDARHWPPNCWPRPATPRLPRPRQRLSAASGNALARPPLPRR